jgi:hypothetical protein|tara:strand:+ start:8143 stop:8334 length:192 start_codon:yes stop_codon:yes gene_type:complete
MLVSYHLVIRAALAEKKMAIQTFSKGALHFKEIVRLEHSALTVGDNALNFPNRCVRNIQTEIH